MYFVIKVETYEHSHILLSTVVTLANRKVQKLKRVKSFEKKLRLIKDEDLEKSGKNVKESDKVTNPRMR